MKPNSRRDFLADVGRGMLISSVGASLAFDLGLAPAVAGEDSDRLTFGSLEPLVAMLQETPADQLVPALAERVNGGTDLKTLVAAASLANARTFGGQDYIGFHTLMALAPAWYMAQELPSERRALPVFKVLYRNTNRIHEHGGVKSEVLHAIEPAELPADAGGQRLQADVRNAKWDEAERDFAAMCSDPGEAFNHLQFTVQDEVDVHRVVLAWRAWATLDFTGQEHANTLLRQSVRYCLRHEDNMRQNKRPPSPVRSVLPKLLEQYKLPEMLGNKPAEDGWVDHLARTITWANREQAAEAAAAALAEGFSPDAVGDALCLAANLLVLHDPGRQREYEKHKPVGSVHGDSVGVHASDSANAWRNIALASNPRNVAASLIVGAFHTAGQSGQVNKDAWLPQDRLDALTSDDAATLLGAADEAIRNKDQAGATAAVQKYGSLNHDPRAAFELLLKFATSEDGALHGEKYYRTVSEEFARAREAFRWRHLVGLARVTASEYGAPAPGYRQACEVLKVEA